MPESFSGRGIFFFKYLIYNENFKWNWIIESSKNRLIPKKQRTRCGKNGINGMMKYLCQNLNGLKTHREDRKH